MRIKRSDHFFSARTFSTIANQIPGLTVAAVGMTFVLIIAGIDLSVGSVLALCGSIISVAVVNWHFPVLLALLLGLVVGLVCGLINGTITVTWAIPSFIVTLGMMEMARGGAYLITGSRTVYIGESISAVSVPVIAGISPAFLITLFIVILAQVVLSFSVFGRYMIGIGTNEEAMRLSGINPKPIKIAVFCIVGFLSGLAARFHCSRLEASDPNAGMGFELKVIAAVVIGGTSLLGGRGSVFNTFIGVLIISVLSAGLAQVGATEPTKRLITGAVIIAAVIIDMYRNKFKLRRKQVK